MKTSYHRLMLALSILDFFSSMGMILLGPWAVPIAAKRYVAGARGTVATCEVSGFLFTMFYASLFYAVVIQLYFLLKIRFEWQEVTVQKFIEIPAHLILTVVYMIVIRGIVPLVMNEFNPLEFFPGWCWRSPFPPNCDNIEVECERGIPFQRNLRAMIGLDTFILMFIVLSLTSIVLKVRSTEQRLLRYASGRSMDLTRETAIQAFLYVCTFLVTYVPIALVYYLYFSDHHQEWYFVVFVAASKLFSPLQGLFNSLVYMRKRYKELFREGGTLGFLRLGQWIAGGNSERESSTLSCDSGMAKATTTMAASSSFLNNGSAIHNTGNFGLIDPFAIDT